MVKVFLAGRFPYPVSFVSFSRYYIAQKCMEGLGHDVYNPCDNLYTGAWNLIKSAIECIYNLARADVVFLTIGWKESKFARFEYILSKILRKEIGM